MDVFWLIALSDDEDPVRLRVRHRCRRERPDDPAAARMKAASQANPLPIEPPEGIYRGLR